MLNNKWRVAGGGGIVVCVAGCQLAALFGGKGTQVALFKFDKNQRVLVLVDVRDGVTVPPDFENMLAQGVGEHQYRYKAADHIVSQERLMALQDKDPKA